MQSVIQYNTPNAETIKAIEEARSMINDPNVKVYSSFSEVLKELEEEDDDD